MTGLPVSGSALETVKLPLHSSSSDSCRSRSSPGPGMLTVRLQPTRDSAFSADRPALGQRQSLPTPALHRKAQVLHAAVRWPRNNTKLLSLLVEVN